MKEYQFVDALTFIYHSFAHSTDGKVSIQEQDAIIEKILKWKLVHNEDELRQTIENSRKWYSECLDKNTLHETIQETIDMLKMSELPEGVRITVINDLLDIAMADGQVYETELHWIRSLANTWNIPVNF